MRRQLPPGGPLRTHGGRGDGTQPGFGRGGGGGPCCRGGEASCGEPAPERGPRARRLRSSPRVPREGTGHGRGRRAPRLAPPGRAGPAPGEDGRGGSLRCASVGWCGR